MNFLTLPIEVQFRILAYVPSADLSNVSKTCKWFHEFGEYFWHYKAELLFPRWVPLLGENQKCSWRWLCYACETPADSSTFTGLGCLLNHESAELFHVPQIEIEPQPQAEVSYLNSYVGEFVNGKYEGFGIFQPCDMIHCSTQGKSLARQRSLRSQLFKYYVGEWKDGQHDGYGSCHWTNGQYRGEYVGGMRHGQGVYSWFSNDAHYDGEFRRNSMWGRGKFTWPDGYIEGDWKHNELHGDCHIYWNHAGSHFSGTYQLGLRETGIYTWADGSEFEGRWSGAHRDGYAKMTFANGLVFEGYYENDVRHGGGTLTWPNGDTFEGRWRDGRRLGSGIFKSNGIKEEQYWNEPLGTRYSEGAERYPTTK